MSASPENILILCTGLLIFTGYMTFLVIALYVAYTKLDALLGYFQNSPAVMIRAPFKNSGPWGRLFVLGAIVGVIKTPGLYLPDGGVSAEDIARFPQGLRKRLLLLNRVGGGFIWALMTYSAFLLVDWSTMGVIRLTIVVATLVVLCAWGFLCVYLGSTQINHMAGIFKHSESIQSRLKLDAGGYFGKGLFIVAASVIVVCSPVFIKRGTLDVNDLRGIPGGLKLTLYGVFFMTVCLMVTLCVLYLFRR